MDEQTIPKICKGCKKDGIIWNYNGYGWCCVQHWKIIEKNKKVMSCEKYLFCQFILSILLGICFSIVMILVFWQLGGFSV